MSSDKVIPFEEASKAEKENIEKTKTLFGEQIKNYIDFYELLYNLHEHAGNQSIAKKIIFDHRDSVVLMISARIVLTSKAYLDLVLKGYYYDSEVIYRSLVESIGVMRLLVNCKDTEKANKYAKKWLKGKLELRTVKEELNLTKNSEFSRLYGGLSDYVHSNFEAVGTLIKCDYAQGSLDASPKPTFKPECTLNALYPHTEFTASLLLENFQDIIEPEFKSQTINTLKKLNDERKRLKQRTKKCPFRNTKNA